MEPDTDLEKKTKKRPLLTDRPDDWLLRQWKSGNEEAAEILYDRYAMRMVALVASRLSQRYRGAIDPREVTQSAMGSFFHAVRQSRIHVSGSLSLWRMLSTFARRKMTRSLEKNSAAKRGGHHERISWDEAEARHLGIPGDASEGAADFFAAVKHELPQDLRAVLEGLLAGQSQREIAEANFVDERTVRRRIKRIRDSLASTHVSAHESRHARETTTTLPRVHYREFVLGKLIGSGGFGKVYRAAMQSDGRVVAVKFLRKAFWKNENARQMFLREIEVASRIDHPRVIRYLGYGESPHGGPYVISNWIDGPSLQRVGSVATNQFTDWLLQICDAIEVVHQAGLVHGDLTPSNILVDAQNHITITDFGFSQAFADSDSPLLGGTLGFAAPEQIDQAFGGISDKTDIYAIGGLVHWFLLGRPPNAGQSLEHTLALTLSPQELHWSTFDSIPEGFRTLLAGTLCKSPADRSLGIADLVQLLKNA